MTINNIQLALGASSYGAYNQKLTQTTKQKLEELGIQYNQNITEQEAKKLIAKCELNAQNSKETNKESSFSNKDKDKDELFEQLRSLAQKIGINVSENNDFKSLINIVENTIEEKIKAASNDESELLNLKNLSLELANIQSKSVNSQSLNNSNQALMMSLEMLSQYNKNFLYN